MGNTEEQNIVLLYRRKVKAVCIFYQEPEKPQENKDVLFYAYLDDHYRETKDEISQPTSQQANVNSIRSSMIIFAMGLLTYGRLDVVDDVLDGVASAPRNIRKLAEGLQVILPIPPNLYVLSDTEAVRRWFHENRTHLKFDQKSNRFIYSNHVNEF